MRKIVMAKGLRVTAKRRTVTAKYLRELGASCGKVERFEKLHPKGLAVTKKNCLLAAREEFDLNWFAERTLPPQLLEEYERQEAPLLEEYQRQRDSLLEEYKRQRAPLRKEYERQRDSLLEEYERQRAPLQEEYKRHREEYQRQRDSLLEEYKRQEIPLWEEYKRQTALLLWACFRRRKHERINHC